MRNLILVLIAIVSSTVHAGGQHCVLDSDVETNNYTLYSEYFVYENNGDITVTVVDSDGNQVPLNCETRSKLGKVLNCGPNGVNFITDNDGDNADSDYTCNSKIGFQTAEDVLGQLK